ncbi:hypothetical protein [Nonomuraea sp. LPB2021202275-12-8]|uniref:hypothetical protein n=1 Tax=Nonomuraea sp. LPB2021202275-12-8 TaxID=3120159 RepID=UPI00300C482A
MADSFFAAIKNEWLHRFVFTTRAKAKSEVIRYHAFLTIGIYVWFFLYWRCCLGLGLRDELALHGRSNAYEQPPSNHPRVVAPAARRSATRNL